MKGIIKERIKEAPDSPGVYVFKDDEGKILYVGKAKSLKKRVKSYLNASHLPYKIQKMLEKAAELEFITTDSELNAFILESNLIKTHKPPFNVLLKDDKHYPYIRIDIKDPYPYLDVTRRIKNDGALYYGPYVPAWTVKETLKTITQAFPIRRCKHDLTRTKLVRPCLNYQIKRCLAPCQGYVSKDEYREMVEQVIAVLEGKGELILSELEKRMKEAADKLEFERAARLRNQIFAIRRVTEKQKVLLKEDINLDVIASYVRGKSSSLCILFVRKGMLIGEKTFVMDIPENELLEMVIRDYYLSGREIPDIIVTLEKMADYLEQALKKEKPILQIKKPWNEEIKELCLFAQDKARVKLYQSERERNVLVELKEILSLSRVPHRIEGYDISNLYGSEAVGSVVVFIDGKPSKENYRRFKVKLIGIDDYSMHEEVLKRRLRHTEWELPDLIVIDGGKGHLMRAKKVIEEMGLDIDVIAISKGRAKEDQIWSVDGKSYSVSQSEAFKLIQHVRDESHRFAISYHRRLQKKKSLSSLLDKVKGIGEKRKRVLLEIFERTEVSELTVEKLVKEAKLPASLAADVINTIREEMGWASKSSEGS